MGMFDWVNYETICPVCWSKVDGFQTKDTDCVLAEVDPCKTAYFYSSCKKCGCWLEFMKLNYITFRRSIMVKTKLLSEYTKEIIIPNKEK